MKLGTPMLSTPMFGTQTLTVISSWCFVPLLSMKWLSLSLLTGLIWSLPYLSIANPAWFGGEYFLGKYFSTLFP
jgi:hypothetical protein